MNDFKLLKHPDFGTIQTEVLKDEVWFCANDVCRALRLTNPRDAIKRHCFEGDVTKNYTLTEGGKQRVNFVNESGLYALIFNSEKEQAKRFKHWVTSDVLPSLRRTGFYGAGRAEYKGENLEVMRMLKVIDSFLLKGDKKRVSEETGFSQQSVISVIKGYHRSPVILKALFDIALENSRKLNSNLYMFPSRAIELLMNQEDF